MDARNRWLPWLPVVAWIGVIVVLGGGGFPHQETSRILVPLLHWLFPDWDPQRVADAHGLLRKLAHPTEYGVLGALAWRALWLTRPPRAARVLPALMLVALVSSADELRQSTIASRTGSPRDVGLDFAGGVAGVLVAPPVLRRLSRRKDDGDGEA